MSPEIRSPEDRATRREWLGLAVIALPCLLYSMDLTVLNLAVPALSVELRPSGPELLWILDVYGFLVAGSLITMGTLADRVGRRRLLLIGAASFGAASVFAAFARTSETLIVARAALGLTGATLAPSTLSLVRNMFRDPSERRLAISIWISSYSAGTALGPLVGGLVLEHFWPGVVFLIGVPAMVLLLATGPLLLPEFRDLEAGELDFPSATARVSSSSPTRSPSLSAIRHWRSTCSMGWPNPRSIPSDKAATSSARRSRPFGGSAEIPDSQNCRLVGAPTRRTPSDLRRTIRPHLRHVEVLAAHRAAPLPRSRPR